MPLSVKISISAAFALEVINLWSPMMKYCKQRFFFILFLYASIPLVADVCAQSITVKGKVSGILEMKDKKEAMITLDKLLISSSLTAEERISILTVKAKTYLALNKYEQAIRSALATLTLAKKNKLPAHQARANKLLGNCYYYLGEASKALSAYRAAIDFYENSSDLLKNDRVYFKESQLTKANLLNNIALAYTSLGSNKLALQSYQLAQPLYQKFGTEMDQIDVRYNIASLHINLEQFDLAIHVLKEVIKKRTLINDKHGVATAIALLGVCYKRSGQYLLAKQHTLTALEFFKEKNYPFDMASQLHNISEIYNELRQPVQAMKYAYQAIKLSSEIGHKKAYSGSLHSLSTALFSQGELSRALKYITLSSSVAKEINYQRMLDNNQSLIALIYAAQGKYSQALTSQRYYMQVQRESANEALNVQLAKFESEQLSQQVVRLEHNRKLQQLQSKKSAQLRYFILLALVLFLSIAFLVYRRYLEGKLTKELEKRVKQRTEELDFFMEELQQANQVKSQFLANISHEIRTPLTSIIGHCESIVEDDLKHSDIQQELTIIHSNSLHLFDLINDILDLSKIEANKLELEFRQCDLIVIIQELVDMFHEQARKKGLTFTVCHQLSVPFLVNVDGLRLKQVLINLCSNAIKFTSSGSVRLDVSWQKEQLHFKISDTGIGMSEQQLSHIFELFSQGDNSISRRFGGSGLGLYLSNQLAKLMLGEISVTSQLAQGSRFYFSLPCEHTDIGKQESPVSVEQPGEVTELTLYQGLILLAEDHLDNQRLITRWLERLGLDVLCACDGLEVIDLCQQHAPLMILLDIQMPKLDGVQTLKQLQSIGYKGPIYALTANVMVHEVSEYMSLGFDGHLKKPIERKEFVAVIDKYFGDKAQAPEKATHVPCERILADVDLSDLKRQFQHNILQERKQLFYYKNNDDMKQLSRMVHRIAGTAKMFGFVELNQAAKELEVQLKTTTEHSTGERVDELFYCLMDEITAATMHGNIYPSHLKMKD